MRVLDVDKGSVGDELGIKPGDDLTAFDGHKVVDILDYEYYNGAEAFVMTVVRDGTVTEYEVEKYEDEDLGLSFDREIPPVTCRNKCIFCFVDQLPKENIRPTLKVKDDDYRHSFLSGNYVTMTNMTDEEIERVIRLKLSPLYISVHTADPILRLRMLGIKRAPDIVQQMTRLAAGGIRMHAQIVYCPGINEDYIETAKRIEPLTESLAIVPVGLTAFSGAGLKHVSQEDAQRVVRAVEAFAQECLSRRGTRYMFASDEFYLKAGLSVPADTYYEDMPQIENGVGLVASFKRDFDNALGSCGGAPGWAAIATGVSAYPLIKACADKIVAVKGGRLDVYKIENTFFGPSVTVAGLVTGGDILRTLGGRALGERLIIPSVMLREFGDVFLDNMRVQELSGALHVPVEVIPPDGESFVKRILK